ncbi:MAG: bactofilin family protein [Cellvibrionaceae bacterium]
MGKLVGNTATTLIARGTEIVGDIHFSGTLHVEGILRGNVVAKEGSNAHLDIQEHGVIEGQVHVPTVRIDGRVIGDVVSTKHVELAAKAQIEGNVHYHLIEMVKGSQVNGSLVYGGGSDATTSVVSEPSTNLEDSSSPGLL